MLGPPRGTWRVNHQKASQYSPLALCLPLPIRSLLQEGFRDLLQRQSIGIWRLESQKPCATPMYISRLLIFFSSSRSSTPGNRHMSIEESLISSMESSLMEATSTAWDMATESLESSPIRPLGFVPASFYSFLSPGRIPAICSSGSPRSRQKRSFSVTCLHIRSFRYEIRLTIDLTWTTPNSVSPLLISLLFSVVSPTSDKPRRRSCKPFALIVAESET